MGTGKPKKFREKETLKSLPQEEIVLNGPFFYGNLVKNTKLEESARKRAKEYHEKNIHPADKDKFYADNWVFQRNLKDEVVIRKPKPEDELLEDYVWFIFKEMGFLEMNKDRNFKICAGEIDKQVDIFAKDEENIFIVFCTQQSKESECERIKLLIHEISNLSKDIKESVKKYYNKSFRISFLIVTKGILWRKNEEELAKKNNIFVWKESDLESYRTLADQLGTASKYQMYSILFNGKRADEVGEIEVPAMYGGIGKDKYYSFLIQPEKLFKIAYVHRREKSNPKEIEGAYQRMVNKKRIVEIGEYINKGHSFANNIILAFKQKPQFESFEKEKKVGDIIYGALRFPSCYGCAWIIDGQHRLYGYSKSNHAYDHTIPVIAFESLSVNKQANLFLDINEQQTPVNQNLLWDLYPDIYEGSEEEKQQQLRIISLISKGLNLDEESIFNKRIQIPSILVKDKKYSNLTLTNLCDALKDNKLIEKDENLLFMGNYEDTLDYAKERIDAFFEVVGESLSGDWEKGERGILRTNVGLRIFFIIFRMILKYLNYKGKSDLYKKNNLTQFKEEVKLILGPVFSKIKNMDAQKIDDLRSASNKSMVVKNSQMLLWDLYNEYQFGAELWKDGRGWSPPIPNEESDENIKNMLKETELKMKEFILKKLNSFHKDKWWEIGIPTGVQQNINKNIENSLSKVPYKREEVFAYPNEKKFMLYSSTSDLKEVIKYEPNWKQLAHLFGDADFIAARLKSLEELRNAFIGHEERKEEIDRIQKNLGYWETKWIRRCIGLDIPKKLIQI